MAQWIECRARYERMMENGVTKKVVEPYLVDALSCTEAEARVTEELRTYISGDFAISSVVKTKIAEVFEPDTLGDKWYKVKVNFVSIDKKTAAEKRSASYILVKAGSFDEALANFHAGMKGTMADYEIEVINETKIMEVYHADLSGMTPGEKEVDGIAGKHFKGAKKAAHKFVKTVQSDPNLQSVEITAQTSDGQTYAFVTVPGGASTHNPRGDDD